MDDILTIIHNVDIHSTGILLEKMEAKQGCWTGLAIQHLLRCTVTPHFLTVYMSGWTDVENEQRNGCGE